MHFKSLESNKTITKKFTQVAYEINISIAIGVRMFTFFLNWRNNTRPPAAKKKIH